MISSKYINLIKGGDEFISVCAISNLIDKVIPNIRISLGKICYSRNS
jgi:hypothetical protein